ncbi:UBX [Echinococcus multilocularis]|uniref:UBX n=1 Tax=Echinococcus multilocularis TaxID=6211 RepID=A0A068XXU7_ECHMU|nr:UBX [Echinococcus multilocularis]
MSGMIEHFCELTGCDAYTAKSFLDANDGNLQMAVDLFYASTTPQISPSEPPTSQPASAHEVAKRPGPSDASNNAPSTSSNNLNTVGCPPSGNLPSPDQKRITLEQLFAPPYDLMHSGNLRQAMEAARIRRKWILVSLYDDSCFDCRVLNRDVWKDYRIISLIKKNVIFIQFNIKSPDGMLYRNRFTCIDSATHIAFLNPFTGEQKIFWNHLKTPREILSVLSKFLLAHPTPLGSDCDISKTNTFATTVANVSGPYLRSAPGETELAEFSGLESKHYPLKTRRLKAANGTSASALPSASAHGSATHTSPEALTATPSTSSGFTTTAKHSSSLKRRSLDVSSEAGPSKRSLVEVDADFLRFVDLALEEDDEEDSKILYEDVDSLISGEEKPAASVKELPPVTDPTNAFRVALRFPHGQRTVLSLEPSLRLKSLFSYLKSKGYPSSKFELVRVYPRLRLNDLPPMSRIDEIGLAKSDSLFLQDI